ncbi:MAG: hypothetical protein QHH24_02655 [Candidatus Bathyarchaeota archaeon]|nr:hypothetical protein [Candidatus Bathyarchaeota archaeon]
MISTSDQLFGKLKINERARDTLNIIVPFLFPELHTSIAQKHMKKIFGAMKIRILTTTANPTNS